MNESRRGQSFPAPMFIALVALSAAHPFVADSPLVVFPAMAADLETTPAAISLTFTTFLLGLAGGTLVLGPISDARGRKVFLVGGPLLLAVLSVGCAITSNIAIMLLLRALQGVACAASAVTARAAVMDRAGARGAARPFAVLSAGAHMAPMLAPLFGVVLASAGGWRAVFWGMAGLGVIYAVGAALLVPETLPPSRRHGAGTLTTAHRMVLVVRRHRMPAALLASALAMGSHNAYVATSPFIVQSVFAESAGVFAAMLVTGSAAMVGAAILLVMIAHRVAIESVLRWTLTAGCVSASILSVLALMGRASLPVVWSLLVMNAAVIGVVLPTTVIVIQRLGAPFQGTAAAVQGFFNYTVGAMMSPLPALVSSNAILALGGLMTVLLATAAAMAWRIPRWKPHEVT